MLFKMVFVHEELLKTVLACVLDIPEEYITDLVVKNGELPSDLNGVKTSRLDICLSFKNLGEHTLCDVEMQVIVGSDFPKRATFYTNRTQEHELQIGSEYTDLKKTLGIFFLLENIFKSPKYHNIGVQTLLGTDEIVDDNINKHYIELAKIDFENMKIADSDTKMLLLKLMKAGTREELTSMEAVNNAFVQKTLGYVNSYNADEKSRYMLQAHEDWKLDTHMMMTAKYNDGKAAGITEGIAKEKLELAKKMFQDGVDISDISKWTGLDAGYITGNRI